MPPNISLDRLVRKEVALGQIREILPPQTHIGLDVVAPWLDVQSDDVIFEYMKGLTDGLAPARAEDAQSELSQKDFQWVGQGQASVIDWALKDHYSASDVTRYREFLTIVENMTATETLNLAFTGQMVEGFAAKMARDTLMRRRKLDNRIEWLIMQAVETGAIAYNDGKVKFNVDFGRPVGQQNQAPANGLWGLAASDPISDITAVQQMFLDTYGVRIDRAITSRRVLNSIIKSDKFAARTGLIAAPTPSGGTGGTKVDPNYLLDGWGPLAAQQVVANATGLTFIEYDSVFRTRPVGSNTTTNTRFLSDNKIYFLPNEEDLAEYDSTEIGFGKTLTSPHPAGEWQTGFYEWEYEYGVDPWGYDIGTGVKAFPIFPHMELTYTMVVL